MTKSQNLMRTLRLALSTIMIMTATTALIGCSVMQPLHQASPPETLGPWGFRVALVEGMTPTITPDVTASPSSDSIASSPLLGLRLGAGLGSSLEVEDDVYAGGASGGNSLALKWQIMGNPRFEAKAGDTALTIVARVNTGAALGFTSTTITQNYYDADLTLKSYDGSIIIGKRVTDSLGGYLGGKAISGFANADYHAAKNGPVVATQTRSFSTYGALGGIYFSPNSAHVGFDFVVEGQFFRLPATYSEQTTNVGEVSASIAIPFRL